MTTAVMESVVDQIGDTAGTVWRILTERGPLTMAKLVKAVGEPRDAVMQALGWLAREEKVWIEEDGRRRIVSVH